MFRDITVLSGIVPLDWYSGAILAGPQAPTCSKSIVFNTGASQEVCKRKLENKIVTRLNTQLELPYSTGDSAFSFVHSKCVTHSIYTQLT